LLNMGKQLFPGRLKHIYLFKEPCLPPYVMAQERNADRILGKNQKLTGLFLMDTIMGFPQFWSKKQRSVVSCCIY
jgi:hypothetical protein